LESVEDFVISERNKELIFDFIDYCFSEGLGGTQDTQVHNNIEVHCTVSQTDFDKATEDEIRAYVGSIERSSHSDWTKHDYIIPYS